MVECDLNCSAMEAFHRQIFMTEVCSVLVLAIVSSDEHLWNESDNDHAVMIPLSI